MDNKTKFAVDHHVPEGIMCNHHYHIVDTSGNHPQGVNPIVG
ncbi:MAG: hypothetical protein U5R30_10610 [Deltaproteobacteria bacterium]|nr:hypothetical protein [Deltaproteobacteria bacterium]